jgi:5-methylcytosine-specific restriction endonuclease McrA
MMVGLHMSHRKPRGMGGGSGRHAALSNINALCPRCHLGYVEKSPNGALRDGWKVPQWQDPREVLVHLFTGWGYLRDDGSIGSPPLAW